MQYNFYYDETEHSRKINYQTVTANNYNHNFIAAIVGWPADYEQRISEKYLDFIIYFSVFSKIEYIVKQLFPGYRNSMLVDIDAMKYSIIKAINTYQPQRVLEAIYEGPVMFVDELRIFLKDRIVKNYANIILKEHENHCVSYYQQSIKSGH